MPRIPAVLSLLLLGAVPAAGQTARPAACTEPEHHQFDFWIGEWDVTLPNGKAAGTNRIEPILNGGFGRRHRDPAHHLGADRPRRGAPALGNLHRRRHHLDDGV